MAGGLWLLNAAAFDCVQHGAPWFCTMLYTCWLDGLDPETLCKDAMIC